MCKDIKKLVKEYFQNGKATNFNEEIKKALNQVDELTRKIVQLHADGGNWIRAQFQLFISRPTYYRHLNEFYDILTKSIMFPCK